MEKIEIIKPLDDIACKIDSLRLHLYEMPLLKSRVFNAVVTVSSRDTLLGL